MEITEIPRAPEFWFSTVLVSFIVSVAANLVSPHVGALLVGDWLRKGLAVNVLAMPILMVLRLSTMSTVWPIDVVWSAAYAAGYLMMAQMHGRALLAYAFWTPNLIAIAVVLELRWLGRGAFCGRSCRSTRCSSFSTLCR